MIILSAIVWAAAGGAVGVLINGGSDERAFFLAFGILAGVAMANLFRDK